ncbi:hypothetical protein BSLG_002238 [Batrachochytrium salamandrivorans]|nr:hypothetical protein BASA83_000198 [Batrachochytrium salamandrivorans]KAJ1343212.1 hypothetical protein BSLG_002238 [Batrachochytrium salamandrivorans]
MAETESLYNRSTVEQANKSKNSSIGYYDLEKNIGEGNFAKVRLATHTLTGQKVAVKIIDKNKLDKSTSKKLFREVRIMKLLNHKNIVRLYEVIDTPDELYLIMEYVSGGEIFDYLVAHGRMKEKDARKHFREIVSALWYCHSMHVIHRDLKAENLLLDANMNVKVADFGFSNQFAPGQRLNTWCGSPPYAAPELFQGKEYSGPEVDVWSMGVVLYVLVCGSLPFDGSNLAKLRARVISGKFKVPFYMSPDCERLIKKMLVIEPTKRSSLEQVMQDKWYTEGYESEKSEVIPPVAFLLTPDQHRAVLDELEEIGLDRASVEKSLQTGDYDPLAATYYLIADKRFRQKQLETTSCGAVASGASLSGPPASIDTTSHKRSATQTPTKTSRATGLVGIDEEGGVSDVAEHKRHTTEPHSAATPHSATETALPRGLPFGPSTQTPTPASAADAVPLSTRPSSSSHRRRATVTASPVTAAELRKEISGGNSNGNAAPSTNTNANPISEEFGSGHAAALGTSGATKELPPPRAGGRVPSARARTAQIASEFKPKMGEPASAQTAAVPPGAPQLLPPIQVAPRGRAHTMASNAPRPNQDGQNADEDQQQQQQQQQPIPIDQLKKRLEQDSEGPRTARFTFSLNTTSAKEPDQVFGEVVRVLKESSVKHAISGLIATCDLEGIQFELEVCRLPNLALNGLRFKRLAGNTWEYKDLLTNLISKMNF